jgi:hypothetical protein
MSVELPRDMRLGLLRYRGITGVTLYLDKETGKRRILPTAFYLALKDLHPQRYEFIEEAPSIEALIKKYGASDWTKMVGEIGDLK